MFIRDCRSLELIVVASIDVNNTRSAADKPTLIDVNTRLHRALHRLTCGTNFLFLFFVSLVRHHHPALLHHQALILDRLLTFLMAFSTLILKPSFTQSLSLHSHLFLAPGICDLHSVFGSHWRWY